MSSYRNVWVLGGTGFIGQALTSFLKSSPHNKIHMLVHKRIPYRKLEEINTFTGSLAGFDLNWFSRYPPDVIFHLARPAGSFSITRKIAAIKARKANQRIIDYLCKLPQPPVVIYVSGSLMYGSPNNNAPAFESTALNPVSFARHYITGEKPWIDAQAEEKLDVRFARPAWVIGDSSWFKEHYWKYYKLTGKIPCFGDGTQLMSVIHLEDCARMIDCLSISGSKRQNLNIFYGEPITQLEFCSIIAKKTETDIKMISSAEMRSRYGRTATAALLSSIPLATDYTEMHKKSGFVYQDTESMIDHTLSLLKHK
jgi:nucleoside-diphosphate-sugar epimerase